MFERQVKRVECFRADVTRWGLLRSLFVHFMLRLQSLAGLNIHWILIRPLARPRAAPHLPDGIAFRVVQAEELLNAARDPELYMDSEFVRGALARGDIAFGAFEGERLVCYSWRAFASTPHVDGVWVKFAPLYHYGYKAFTRPSHRGRRILVALALFSDSYLLERGRVAQVMSIDIWNLASLAAQRTAGSRRVGLAGYLKWFGFFISFRTRSVKKSGFAFYAGA